METKIPRRIIQTAKTRSLSPLARASAANLKCLNPDFEYSFYDDDDVDSFVRSAFPAYYSVFCSFPFRIQKYDFFRYLAIYKYGGFYFDLDVFLFAPLEPLLDKQSVFPFEEISISRYLNRRWGTDWEIGNYAFGAAPGCPFIEAVIANCIEGQRTSDWIKPMLHGIPRFLRREYYVLNSSGPGLLSRTLAENPELARTVSILFPDDVCDPATWHQFGQFGVHAMEGSWRFRGSFLRRRAGNFWHAWMLQRQLKRSRTLGARRTTDLSSFCHTSAA